LRAHSSDPKLQQYYESDARSIVTYWASGVQNYSRRVCGGLVRDYYREWMAREFASMKNGKPFDANRFMLDYVKGCGTSHFEPCTDPLADATAWLRTAMGESLPTPNLPGAIAQWNPGTITTDWAIIEWNIPADRLSKLTGIRFDFARGNHRLEIQSVALVADGKVVSEDRHEGYAGAPSSSNIYQIKAPLGYTANNGCLIRAVIKGGGGTDSNGNVMEVLEDVRRK
jgi:alpha-N-acetylglucosaminidase